MRALALVLVAGCSLSASTGLTTSAGRGAGPAAASSPTVSSGPPTSVPSGPLPQTEGSQLASNGHFPGMLVRSQLEPLVGMTVDQAKQRLAKLGYDGHLILDEMYHYDEKCGQNKVCAVQPESGTGLHDELRLEINKQLSIAAPPPE